MIFVILVMLLPFVFVFNGSLVSEKEFILEGGVVLFPDKVEFTNYTFLFKGDQLMPALVVSVLRTAIGVPLSLLFTIILAYAISKRRMPGHKGLMIFLIIMMYFDGGIIPFLIMVRDLKLYDIPNTMARTSSIITELGCWAFTVHLQSGVEALRAVKKSVTETAKKLDKAAPLILGVSVLTSSNATKLEINQLVKQADQAGLEGVISSANDVKEIKKDFPKLKVITPGIRNPLDQKGDRKRVATASVAFANGADYIVVGRPIIEKSDYLKAAEEILKG